MYPQLVLILQAIVYGLLGSTNLLFTKKRLSYVFGPDYDITKLDIFWQRDIGIFQLGLATLACYTCWQGGTSSRVEFLVLGFVWTLGAIFLAQTALFNLDLRHITSKGAGLGIAFISAIFAILNWICFFRT